MLNVIVGAGVVGQAFSGWLAEGNGCARPVFHDPPKGYTWKSVTVDDLVWICVPTPQPDNPTIVEEVLEKLPPGTRVAIRSTVSPGQTERLQNKHQNMQLAFVPEFLTEATASHDAMFPDITVVGYASRCRSRTATLILGQLPTPTSGRAVVCRALEAEFIKAFANSFYALKVSYANQFHDLCARIGADYDSVRAAASDLSMITPSHLDVLHNGYRGYGGKCLPKDVDALLRTAKQHGLEMSTLRSAAEYNERLRQHTALTQPGTVSLPVPPTTPQVRESSGKN